MIAIFAFVVGVTVGWAVAGIMHDQRDDYDPYGEPH